MNEFLNMLTNTGFDTFIILVGLAFVANLAGNNKPKSILSLMMLSTLYFWSVFNLDFRNESNSIASSSLDLLIFISIYLIEVKILVPISRNKRDKSLLSFTLMKYPLGLAILTNWVISYMTYKGITNFDSYADVILTLSYWVQVLILVGSNDLFVRLIFSRRYFNRRTDSARNSDPHFEIFKKALIW